MKLLLKLRLLKDDGSVLHANATDCAVALGDCFFASLFSSVSIKLNGQDVEYEPNYPHRAFVETHLNYDKGAKETHLWTSQGWIEDKSLCKDFANVSAVDLLAQGENKRWQDDISFRFHQHESFQTGTISTSKHADDIDS